jgi:hypothetical protein
VLYINCNSSDCSTNCAVSQTIPLRTCVTEGAALCTYFMSYWSLQSKDGYWTCTDTTDPLPVTYKYPYQ